MENYNEMFNPDVSEYNPVISEIENLENKIKNRKKTDNGFFSSIVKKLMKPFVIVIQ